MGNIANVYAGRNVLVDRGHLMMQKREKLLEQGA